MPSRIIKTRFAPSPTGFMHVGNFRTALFAYLWAKKNNGKFILRIEDTDQKREVVDAEQAIFRVLKWAGLEHDEGPDIGGPNSPYRQSERLPIYQKYIQELLEKKAAYYCFCSVERLEQMRQEQTKRGEPVKYDRHCLNLTPDMVQQKIKSGEKYVIRQKINTETATEIIDIIHGAIKFENKILDDQILIKSDGWPTYNFANVVDDHLMEITHIIRGDEYITSTPKYIQLYQSFGWDIPAHAHLPLILNQDKSKLSKRAGHASVEDLRATGYLPETVVNFVALLGWNPGDDRELFTLEQLTSEFDLAKINKSGAVFDLEKLNWMNGHYIRQLSLDKLAELCLPHLKSAGYSDEKFKIQNSKFKINVVDDYNYIKSVVGLEQDRIKTLSEIGEKVGYFFQTPKYDPKLLIWRKADQDTTINRLEFLMDYLDKAPTENWTRNGLSHALLEEIERQKLDNGATLWPMRAALSGQEKSPNPFEIAEVLGKKETIKRLNTALKLLTDSQ